MFLGGRHLALPVAVPIRGIVISSQPGRVHVSYPTFHFRGHGTDLGLLGVTSKKTNSIFADIIQIDGDPPPSYPIFDKFIFDKVLTMLTSLPPLEFLTKIMKF